MEKYEELSPARQNLVDILSNGIINLDCNKNSFTIGLVGEWGCGKTSIFNAMKEKYFEKDNTINSQNNSIIVSKYILENKANITEVIKILLITGVVLILWLILSNSIYIIPILIGGILGRIIVQPLQKLTKTTSLENLKNKDRYNKNPVYNLLKNCINIISNIYKHTIYWKNRILNWLILCVNGDIKKFENDEKKIIIMDFYPWYFENEYALISKFFEEIYQNIILKHHAEEYEKYFLKKKLGKLLKKYGKLISVASSTVLGSEIDISSITNYSKIFSEYGSKNQDIMELKKEIEKLLEELNVKIVIYIDDLDRLTANEIKLMFKLVKNIADFPNTVYILGYDKKIISKALADAQCSTEYYYNNERTKKILNDELGEEYTKKIIQLEYSVPELTKDELVDEFLNKVRTKYDEFDKYCNSNFEKQRFGALKSLKNQRDFNRLYNMFCFEYELVKGYVEPFEFLMLTFIKYRFNKAYELIYEHMPELIEKNGNLNQQMSKEYYEKLGRIGNSLKKRDSKRLYGVMKLLIQNSVDNEKDIEYDIETYYQPVGGYTYEGKYFSITNPDKIDTYFKLNTFGMLPRETFEVLSHDDGKTSKEQIKELLYNKFYNPVTKKMDIENYCKYLKYIYDYIDEMVHKSKYKGLTEFLIQQDYLLNDEYGNIINNDIGINPIEIIIELAKLDGIMVYDDILNELKYNDNTAYGIIRLIKYSVEHMENLKESISFMKDTNHIYGTIFKIEELWFEFSKKLSMCDFKNEEKIVYLIDTWYYIDYNAMCKKINSFDYNTTMNFLIKNINSRFITIESDLLSYQSNLKKYIDKEVKKFENCINTEYIKLWLDANLKNRNDIKEYQIMEDVYNEIIENKNTEKIN
nr:P-loop NTPase fold protein [Methanococcus voltae]